MAYLGRQLTRGENRQIDDIASGFNGSTTAFNLTVSGDPTAPSTAQQLFIALNGALKKAGTDFTVAGSQITFTSAPANGVTFMGLLQGDSVSFQEPSDGTVTASKIANSGDFTFPADIRLKDGDGSHYVGFEAPTTVSANKVWTLPAADGSANQVLTTNGSGVLTWATAGGLSSDAQKNTVGGTNAGDSFTGTDANNNTLIGYDAGTAITNGDNNSLYGYQSGKAITTGRFNTIIGGAAGLSLTTGDNNVIIGRDAGHDQTTASDNVLIGANAAYALSTGIRNILIGENAGRVMAAADYNIAIGFQAFYGNSGNISGENNIAIGTWAGTDISSGDLNVLIGKYAGSTITTGASNLVLGSSAQPSSATVSNEITLGNSSISTLRCQVTSITALSDRRDKTDINTLDLGLNFIDSLNPVKFKWNSREGILKDGSYEAGFIAQDFQKSQKDFNAEYLNLVLDTNPEKLEAAPGKLIPIMVQAIKELLEEVTTLKTKVALLESA